MSIFRRILFATALLFAASCSEEPLSSDVAPEMIDVMIGCGDKGTIVVGEDTRTVLEDDGISIRWDENDRIALWGHNAAGDCVVDGAELAMWRYNTDWDEACFRGSIPAMAEGAYSYYAVSPIPVNAAGNQIFYSIPAVQDGEYHPEWNILAAEPVAGAPSLVNGYNNDILLDFKSRVHLLRIRIPANSLGEKITAIKLSFDRPVVGSMMMDYTDPSSLSLMESGSSSEITLNFATPKDAGDVVYAFIAPVECETISIIAQGTMYESQPRSVAGKMFAAGHTTPIAYTVPARERLMGTIVRFNLAEANTGANTLGEKANSFTLSVNGAQFNNGSSTSESFAINSSGVYEMFFHEKGGVDPTALSGKTITATYDSNNAIVSAGFTMTAVTAGTTVNQTLPTVPYLLYQDFSGASAFTSNVNQGSGNPNGVSLSGCGLEGWTAARVQIHAGTAAQVSVRHETVAQYPGRLDTSTMPLKSGASVNIRVSFTAQRNNQYVFLTCGTIDGTDPTTGNKGVNSGTTITPSLNTSANASNIPSTVYTFTASGFTSTKRVSWVVERTYKFSGNGFSSNTWYAYIDNVKVQIAN